MALLTDRDLMSPETWASVTWNNPASPEPSHEVRDQDFVRINGVYRLNAFMLGLLLPVPLAQSLDNSRQNSRRVHAKDDTIPGGTVIESQYGFVVIDNANPEAIASGEMKSVKRLWYVKTIDVKGRPAWARSDSSAFASKYEAEHQQGIHGIESKLKGSVQCEGYSMLIGPQLSRTRQAGRLILKINVPFAQHVPVKR